VPDQGGIHRVGPEVALELGERATPHGAALFGIRQQGLECRGE